MAEDQEKPKSDPPTAKIITAGGTKLVDMLAIVCITFLAFHKIITSNEAVMLIALFAGAHIGQIINGNKNPSGVVVSLAKLYGLGKIGL